MVAEVQFSRTRQQLGAYYTPLNLAQLLTNWAITKPSDNILDPSFGGCSFLYAALKTLQERHVANPGAQIYGVDIDPSAVQFLSPLLEAGAAKSQFLTKNFFNVLPLVDEFPAFDSIVGNPPYVNYHHIDRDEQKLAMTRLKEMGVQISGRSSYWAFFLIHSLRFLRHGGRMAMVLPSSFARADYAADVRHFLARQFSKVHIIFVQERLFEDTEEQAVVVLASDFGHIGEDTNIIVQEVASVEALESVINNSDHTVPLTTFKPSDNLYHGLLTARALEILQLCKDTPSVIQLGDWVNVRIGVVTGSNRFFIMSRSKQHQLAVPDNYTTPIITRPSYLTGLYLRQEDVMQVVEQDKLSLLLSVDNGVVLPEEVQTYIDTASEYVRNARKCKERKPWYAVLHRLPPPAFFQYMSATWPRLVVNESQATCTNNIHRLQWKSDRPATDWVRLAVGCLSSLSQLSAELVGRNYGGGVLKLEPKEVVRLLVPIGDVPDNLVESVDQHLRQREIERATQLVDQHLLISGLGLSNEDVAVLRQARDSLHRRRRA